MPNCITSTETPRERAEREDRTRRTLRDRNLAPILFDGNLLLASGVVRQKCGGGYRILRKKSH